MIQEGEISKKFYMILRGCVGINKLICFSTKMSPLEYLKKILHFKANDDCSILKKTLKANKEIYPLDNKDLEEIDEIIFKVNLKKFIFTNI